ncbi:hypothetical protein AAES_53756 [Amazona aestiva]|uniref:Uncharacterized protein n=1 Tax=Amazona aestiva TaxID=12930 RepID=A0A0Q3PS45_AMAAE|nr:hypothetical protein AAES_53756 [Amazona aestiva]
MWYKGIFGPGLYSGPETGLQHVVTVGKRGGKATSMVEKGATNKRITYRTKGLELKHEDSNLENLNISYVEQDGVTFSTFEAMIGN